MSKAMARAAFRANHAGAWKKSQLELFTSRNATLNRV